MRVLLIGKFPPVQGGIASKTYWLYRSLSRRGFIFDIVTLVPELYACRDQAELPSAVRVRLLEANTKVPWFIPGGGLETERLIAAALEIAADARPDVVECNYLAPYGTASLVVSRSLGVPLIVRHAGSDLAKLLGWDQTRSALECVLTSADLVVSNVDAIDRLKHLTAKIVALPRYSPDPEWFNRSCQVPEEPLILYAGKLNYYWRLKALDTLLSALRIRHSWNLLAIVGGKGRQAFEAAVQDYKLENRVRFLEFLPPDRMPEMIGAAPLVWAVERQGDISEFSNTVWEALSCGRTCLVSPKTIEHPDAATLSSSPLLMSVDPDDPVCIASSFDRSQTLIAPQGPDFREAHRRYVDSNASIYEEVCRGLSMGLGNRGPQS
jgi:glycosyltransferase involved in cell wall biosynthesis